MTDKRPADVANVGARVTPAHSHMVHRGSVVDPTVEDLDLRIREYPRDCVVLVEWDNSASGVRSWHHPDALRLLPDEPQP